MNAFIISFLGARFWQTRKRWQWVPHRGQKAGAEQQSLLCPLLIACFKIPCFLEPEPVLRIASWMLKLGEKQQVFIKYLDVLTSMTTTIRIGNAPVILLIIWRGTEVKTNWAGKDRKQDITCLGRILSKLNRDCTMCPVIRTTALGQILPVKTCLQAFASQPQLR